MYERSVDTIFPGFILIGGDGRIIYRNGVWLELTLKYNKEKREFKSVDGSNFPREITIQLSCFRE